jgi:hypothetical protein
MGWSPNHKRIREKYNPVPNAEERRHEQRLETLPCIGCGRFGVELHHTMVEFPEKRFRRDHRYQLPVCADCHRGPQGIHGIGSEAKWAETVGLGNTGQIALMLWENTQRHRRAA